MKTIIVLYLFFLFTSCSTHRTIQQEQIREKTTVDSTFNHVLTNKNIEIEWIFDNDTTVVPFLPRANDTVAKPHSKFTPQKIPRYGKIRIHISNDSISTKSKVEATTKVKAKTKKKEPVQVLKPKKSKKRFNFLYIIIIGFCVKFLWDARKSLKKIWKIIK